MATPKFRIPPPPIDAEDKTVWSAWYLSIKDTISRIRQSLTWELLDFTNSNITDILTRNHNDLQNIQGGAANENYHLTSTEYLDLTDGGGTTLHTHAHNSTTSLQGGTTNEYYHLTSDEYDDLFGTGGGGGAGGGGARWRGGVDTTDDIIIDSTTAGLVLKSPDGDYWRILITNAGALTSTNLGATKP